MMMNPPCAMPDCSKLARSRTADLCPMHYHRLYRHGDVGKTALANGVSVSAGRRYRSVYLPRHPLAGKNGKVYAHRLALYERIGAGFHPCHWCRKPVTWDATRGDPEVLSVDHLNGVGDDNGPENLVPACWACNTGRGAQARHRALLEAGWWSNHDTIARLARRRRRPPIEAAA